MNKRDAPAIRTTHLARSAKPTAQPWAFVRRTLSRIGVHLLLVLFAVAFVFPFAWMLTTSIKTDEEINDPSLWPGLPRFRDASPYARRPVELVKPGHIDDAPWDAAVPQLLQSARRALTDVVQSHPPPIPTDQLDAYVDASASVLVSELVGRLDLALWSQPVAQLVAAFERLIAPEAIAFALDDRLARLELRQLQLRALDTRIFNLSAGEQIATTWRVESGDASLVPTSKDVTQLRYRFASSDAEPVVLRYDFPSPIKPADLHRLSLAIKSDDSWNRLTATLDVAGRRWVTERRWDFAQHRAQSIFFQPPTFDDETYQPKVWVKLRDAGPSPPGHGETGKATLRVILSPASTLQAALARVERNFGRSLDYMPFWTYVRNSVILVALTTLGTLFSSTFVAYALARLHWPGRNVAMLVMLATIMLPAQVTMIPTFVIWKQLGWYNTLNPLWVPAFFGGAFFIFLMTQAMKTLPRELEESARIDGLNHVQTWYYIILPQVKPVMAAIAIMTFMWSWNEFMGPLIYLRDQSKFPLSLGLFTLRIDSFGDWTMIMAGNVLMTLPVVVMFFVFQRYFVQGMTMSGIKG